MNLSKNPIAGFVACPKCGRPSLVHFPKGGPRRKSPYLSCPEHGNAQDIPRDYFIEHTVKTLPEFADKHGDSEHCTELAQVLERYQPVINNELLSLMHPITDDVEQETIEEKEETVAKQPQEKRLFDEQGNIIDEQNPTEQSDKPKSQGEGDSAALMIVAVLVSVVLVTGGYVVVKRIQRNKQKGQNS